MLQKIHLNFWQWIADYYSCNLGDVMHAAVPAGLKLTSETLVTLSEQFHEDYEGLSDDEYLIAEALTVQHQLTLEDIEAILDKKTIYPVIHSLLVKGVLHVKEELQEDYKAKLLDFVYLKPPYDSSVNAAFELLDKAPKQSEALLTLYQMLGEKGKVSKRAWYSRGDINTSVKNALINKGIIEVLPESVSRIERYAGQKQQLPVLNEEQHVALNAIKHQFDKESKPILLHGVTGSGKTRIYIELAKDAIHAGKQVLYLLPEIALTAHLVNRLRKVFGEQIIVFHSKMNNAERVEVWNAAAQQASIILGARSSLFLPFKNLGLIIVDEEHDRSYKQDDPAPRYNARDAAVFFAQKNQVNIILGTATPSFESFHNVEQDKYLYAKLTQRIGNTPLPKFIVMDLKEARRRKEVYEEFSTGLLQKIKQNLDNGKQIILFQNRRGFSPFLRCNMCGWHATCIHCDVSQTYHKYFHKMICHYCNYQIVPPTRCPDCGHDTLDLHGFGTEKIQEVLKTTFPLAKIGRMDLDTVRTKKSHEKIMDDFEHKRIDILVGTQMVTKGLDFDSVGLVAIIHADLLLNFPDFRAHERAYQLITQVAGRAGRRQDSGEVVLQTTNPDHPVLKDVQVYDFANFYRREIRERSVFLYPPFYRLILIVVKHKKPKVCIKGAGQLAKLLEAQFGNRVKGPTEPMISRIRNQYIRHILIKIEKDAQIIKSVKFHINEYISQVKKGEGMSTLRCNVNVDPY